MSTLKRTPLWEAHVAASAKMVPFAGFEMPVSYTGVIDEHTAVRERVGLFDASHMGEFLVTGPDTWAYLDYVVTNDCSKLAPDGVLYTVMCRENGTVVDDLLVMKLADDRALVVVNASNIDKDLAYMQGLVRGRVELADVSDDWALIAVQGPRAVDAVKATPMLAALHDEFERVPYYRWRALGSGPDRMIVSRTGYTGERGFEIFVAPERARALWDELMAAGRPLGTAPAGLGARDTLRFEASLCLYGHELDDETTPLEAGLGWLVKLGKPDFVGREALAAEKAAGPRKQLLGFELEGRAIARHGYTVLRAGEAVGKVTSGTYAPTLGKSLCMAYVNAGSVGADLAIQVRTSAIPARRVALPFYPSRARA